MVWCQGNMNIGLSNHKLKSAKVHRMITMQVRPRQTDRWTDGQTDGRTNIVAMARRFVLTNASRVRNEVGRQYSRHKTPLST